MTNQTEETTVNIDSATVRCYFNISAERLIRDLPAENVFFVTDENVFNAHPELFPRERLIIIPSGEPNKNLDTVSRAIDELHDLEAGRDAYLIGIGGGVVTDVSGFIASVYLRGIKFSFVPTSILAMVDAAIGGKNGVNAGQIKNQIGVIRQPQSLYFDFSTLQSLPEDEWISGFAEIIKHACIRDKEMFQFLENNTLEEIRKDENVLSELIRKNVNIKLNIVAEDENEMGARRLLNFGHTLGHSIENLTKLPHGFAVAVGMVFACRISERLSGFDPENTKRLIQLLQKYHLPVSVPFDKDAAWRLLVHDKKKAGDHIHFILLNEIGEGVAKKLPLTELKNLFFEM